MFSSRFTAQVASVLVCCAMAATSGQEDQVARAYELRMDGATDEAKALLEAEVKHDPSNASAWFELARVEFQRSIKLGELDTAQQAIERAVALEGENVQALCLAGRIAMYNFIMKHHGNQAADYLPQMEKATSALERALELDPECHEARLLLVSCYGNNPENLGGDRARAEEHVEALERVSPVRGAEARCDFSDTSAEDRVELWKKIEEDHGSDPLVHENLARAYARSGNIGQANAHIDRALELDPSRGEILLGLGVSLVFDQRVEEGKTLLERYLEHKPQGPRALQAYAYMLLSRIQGRQGDESAAERSMKKARELDSYCWPTMRPPPAALFSAL